MLQRKTKEETKKTVDKQLQAYGLLPILLFTMHTRDDQAVYKGPFQMLQVKHHNRGKQEESGQEQLCVSPGWWGVSQCSI